MHLNFKYIPLLLLLLFPVYGKSQQDSLVVTESQQLDLQFLIAEAVEHNPEIQSADLQWDMLTAKIPQTSSLDEPELQLSQMEIPGFNFGEAMYTRIELMQMFPFPGKRSLETDLVRFESEHGHHNHLEKINEVIAKLK